MNQKGIAVIGVVALTVVFGLFIAYVTGHPLSSKKEPVAVVQPVVEPVVAEVVNG